MKATYSFMLTDTLQSLVMKRAFTPGSTNLAPQRLRSITGLILVTELDVAK
jgi:hypothetical protein